MNLAVSNIAWLAEQDEAVYQQMADMGVTGLEIAPTRWFPEHPYERLSEAAALSKQLRARYGFSICSMQSIWYGRTERIAESPEARRSLLDYTGQAIRFADAVRCRNLVFGCPRNRNVENEEEARMVEEFLCECAEQANLSGIVLALEPNPPIYHTNYLNTTRQVLELLERLNHPALRLNLDFGTVIENREDLQWIAERGEWIHHVHISEPNLAPIQKRPEHRRLKELLVQSGYQGFVSIEMGRREDLSALTDALEYVGRIQAAVTGGIL